MDHYKHRHHEHSNPTPTTDLPGRPERIYHRHYDRGKLSRKRGLGIFHPASYHMERAVFYRPGRSFLPVHLRGIHRLRLFQKIGGRDAETGAVPKDPVAEP